MSERLLGQCDAIGAHRSEEVPRGEVRARVHLGGLDAIGEPLGLQDRRGAHALARVGALGPGHLAP
eukprot:10297860-Lingulodinium_polyedra.AAC.1